MAITAKEGKKITARTMELFFCFSGDFLSDAPVFQPFSFLSEKFFSNYVVILL